MKTEHSTRARPPSTADGARLVRVALIEDVADVRESWRQLIDTLPGFRCACVCASGEAALRQIPAEQLDVILMDIQMPGMSGIECTARLKVRLPKIPILILTVSADSQTVFRALEAGADGYLLKSSRPDELRTAVLDVIAGGAPMTSEIARRVVASFRQRVSHRDEASSLTAREEEVLVLLSKGLASKEIADQLAVTYETVRDHLKHIYGKLHVHSRTEAVARYFSTGERDA